MTKLTFGSDRTRRAESKTIINLPSSQKHPIFGLWEFLENSRATLEGKFIIVFDSARRVLSDPKDSLVTKILLVVENFSLSQSEKI